MMASLKGRTDIVELLIKHNANVNARHEVRLYTRDMHVRELEEVIQMCVYVFVCVFTSECVDIPRL